MSFKPLFARSLAADPERLHLAAHSHHLWPDASFEGQAECWNDAARLADRKWDRIMGEVWPEAQAHVARELGSGAAEAIVFASNTHDFLVRLFAACPRPGKGPTRVLTSDGEFHSARRQLARWEESGDVTVTRVPAEPFGDFSERFTAQAEAGGHDLILVSHVFFSSGRCLTAIERIAELGRSQGPWVVFDGYHAFMAIDQPLPANAANSAFYLGGGYKYAMSGEGAAFLHAPSGFGSRPPITGWFAEFEDLSLPPGMVGYATDASRFLGATFDPSGLYRFNAVQRMLEENGLTTARISGHVANLQAILLDAIRGTPLAGAELLNPLGNGPHARFLAFRGPAAARWSAALKASNCITDVRGDVIRVGLGLYNDESDIAAFAGLARRLS